MTVQSQQTNCGNCGELLEESASLDPSDRRPCSKCGSVTRAHRITISETIHVKEMLGLKGKRPGQKKPFMEQKSGDDLHRKSDLWNKLIRIIDRGNNWYKEEVTDPTTGEIIHKDEGPLSEHRGHGDARKKKSD